MARPYPAYEWARNRGDPFTGPAREYGARLDRSRIGPYKRAVNEGRRDTAFLILMNRPDTRPFSVKEQSQIERGGHERAKLPKEYLDLFNVLSQEAPRAERGRRLEEGDGWQQGVKVEELDESSRSPSTPAASSATSLQTPPPTPLRPKTTDTPESTSPDCPDAPPVSPSTEPSPCDEPSLPPSPSPTPSGPRPDAVDLLSLVVQEGDDSAKSSISSTRSTSTHESAARSKTAPSQGGLSDGTQPDGLYFEQRVDLRPEPITYPILRVPITYPTLPPLSTVSIPCAPATSGDTCPTCGQQTFQTWGIAPAPTTSQIETSTFSLERAAESLGAAPSLADGHSASDPQTPETDEEDESGLDPLFYLPSTHVASKLAPVAVVVESDKKRRTATWFLLTASAVGVASTVGLLLSV